MLTGGHAMGEIIINHDDGDVFRGCWTLDKIIADEEEENNIEHAVVVYLSEEKGDTFVLKCRNIISLSVDGPWANRAVEFIKITSERCGEEWDSKTRCQMIVELIGSKELKIVCEKIAGERLPSE